MASYLSGEGDQLGLKATTRGRASRVDTHSSTPTSSKAIIIDSNDKYRMGTLGPLLPLSLEDSPIQTQDELTRSWINIRPEIIELLQKWSVNFHTISLLHRSLPTRPQAEFKTILIVATADALPDPWVKIFLEDCYSHMVDEGKADNLIIEIIDHRVLNRQTVFPVRVGDPISDKWPSLRRRIHQELGMKKWEALQVLKRGYMIEGEIPEVFIILTVLNILDLKWNPTLERIRQILDEPQYATLDVKLHLIQGTVVMHTGRPTSLAPNLFGQEMGVGSSMGPKSSSRTLGLYLKIRSSLEGAKLLALTNYHAIRTNALNKEHDSKGFRNREGSIKVYGLSLIDKERSIETQKEQADTLEQPIQKLEQRAAAGLHDRAKQLVALQNRREECNINVKKMAQFDCSFGIVQAGSGLRHGPNGFSLDWALVDPQPKRVPAIPNTLPDYLDFPNVSGWQPNPGLQVEKVDPSVLEPKESPTSPCVFKNGRTTGLTWGHVNGIRTDVLLEGKIYTAIDIVPPPGYLHDFSQRGDSGSTIYDAKGSLCGLLLGGTDPIFSHGAGKAHGLVIPIDVIFHDIETFTGFKVELP